MSRNRLYLILTLALTGGYAWLAWAFYRHSTAPANFSPCIVKNVTGIACPSCGSTRSLVHLLNGHVQQAVLANPIGLLLAVIMVVLPFWLIFDIATGKDTVYKNYRTFEKTIVKKWIAVPLVLLIIINWIWNIQKGI
ncbi:DUF2752 domain-containing protein [Flavobacterium sp. D11R37]|uniref:DUF2752 domain-containing protein n=1 Tax=Flavobacterium coralii TaxID=2838017 RepID=UPI000C4D802D|nr:DUF2752 domain-containing protein [Flavobacterium coralii]MBE99262.1 hypothetical protein [Flavobacterium sp.]MBY8961874.1 DUF2752 domain-containing protein [Flavobacterium coralii]